MKIMLRKMINGLLSVLTTFLVMASPVVAIVYAAEPPVTGSSYFTYELATVSGDNRLGDSLNKFVEDLKGELDEPPSAATQEERHVSQSAGALGNRAKIYNNDALQAR